jgi:ATP-dependent RNA helicase DDX56/DBP9
VLNSELPHKSRQHILKEFNQGVFDYLMYVAPLPSPLVLMRYARSAVDESSPASSKRVKAEDDEDDEEKPDGDDENEVGAKKSRKRKPTKDAEFGVSRGVDFKGVKAVINFDFPGSPSAYTHRIGRTARGGDVGMALSFVTPDDEALLEDVTKHQAADGKEVLGC